MIKIDTGYIFDRAGGVAGLVKELNACCPDEDLPYATAQMWKQRGSIPSAWIGAVLYVMDKKNVTLTELLTDADELCAF